MNMQEQQDHSPLTLFYSYANQDEKLCEELEKHLSILQRQGVIAGWHHHKILPGADKNQINDEQFSLAQIIILLISADFLASDASHSEMERALERHRAGLSHVIPLLLRPVDWEPASFAHLQHLPRNGIAVTIWENRDKAFADIAKDIRLAIEQWNSPSLKPPQRSLTFEPPYLFLSFAQEDLSLVNRLKDDLRIQGIMRAKDQQASQSESSDDEEKEDVREAIRSASAVILIGTPHTRRSRLVKQELDIAQMYQRPLYLFWMQGNRLMEVIPTGWSHLPSIDARRERYPQALQDLVQALGRQTSLSFIQDSLKEEPATALPAPRNPYKGLQAFRMEDAEDFFGRDRLIEELLEKVQQLLTMDQQDQAASRLLTILGASGSGKSSVVMAGLLPKLKEGGLAESRHWTYLNPMVPGKHPLEALTLTLTSLFPERSLKSIREDLEDDSARGLHLLLTTYVKTSDARVLLVIDQFEELFTQTAIEGERQQFLDLLLTAISEPQGSLIGLLTLRADFYDRPLQYPELAGLIKTRQVIICAMEIPDLRQVIEKPAQLPDVQITFEESLIGDLLFDVQGQAGALPLLQFTLDQLFQYREERHLTLQAYQQIGRVKGALAQHAESTYQSLPTKNHQRLARALFLRLINPGTVVEDATRRRIPLSELVVVDQEETARLAEVTNAFTRARLLTTNTVEGISAIEVSHEALIQAWTRLQDWLHEARDVIRLQQAISEDATNWNHYGQPADRLYRGSQLIEALRWRETNLPSLDEDRFLQASIKERQRGRRRTFLIGLIGVTGMAGTGFLVTALLERELKSPPLPIGFPKGLPSYTYKGHASVVYGVAWSPDGKHIASGSADHTVQVWDISSSRSYRGHTDTVWSVAWSPDGKRIASGSDDHTVQVWDATSTSPLFTYKGHTNTVWSVVWSPDGKHIASGSRDNTVQIWDASNGSLLLTYKGHTNAIWSVAWSPDGKHIASGSWDRTVQIWDASSGSLQLTYRGHTDAIESVAWSPDGKRIASGSRDFTVQIWDASSASLLLTYKGHTSSSVSGDVSSVAWSPDGKRIASGSLDQTVQICDASSGNLLLTYTGHTDSVNSVAWEPSGKRIASSSSDHTVQVWDASSTHSSLLVYEGHVFSVNSVAWEPSGKRIASGSGDNTVQICDASSGNLLLTYKGHTGSVNSVAWEPSGKRIASGSSDHTVQVWDASTGNLLLTYKGHTSSVNSVTWSSDGKHIASGSDDYTVQVWDASSGSLLLIYNHNHTDDAVLSVAWEPSGKRIASGSAADNTVQVWDATSNRLSLTYMGHTSLISSIAWSPDGKHIASGSWDNTVQVWDASSGSLLLTYRGHADAVLSVAWSPDGKHIASGSRDRTVQVWDASSGSLLLTYTGHTDLVNSVAWSPDGKRIASGSLDHTMQCYDG